MKGYVKLSRSLLESGIFHMPPLYAKVWIYLLICAQHEDTGKLKKGQIVTSISKIQDGCAWYVGYRKEVPSKRQIYRILEWMKTPKNPIFNGYAQGDAHVDAQCNACGPMISIMNGKSEMLITIEKYALYQDSKPDERRAAKKSNSDAHMDAHSNAHGNAHDKHTLFKQEKEKEEEIYMAKFDLFWRSYPRKVKKAEARKAFMKLAPDDALFARMTAALEQQKRCAQWTEDGGKYIPHPATWINGERWEDSNSGCEDQPDFVY